MNVLIVHCWGCDCGSNWFPWLKKELEARPKNENWKTFCPNLPNTESPKLGEWLAEIRKHMKRFDKNWILIGHSLGCPTILNLLQTFDDEEKVKATVLVSAFARDFGMDELTNFVEKGFNWEKIRDKAEKFVVIHSDDDPVFPYNEGVRIAKLLEAKLITEHGLGHIKGEPYGKYQRILDVILSI